MKTILASRYCKQDIHTLVRPVTKVAYLPFFLMLTWQRCEHCKKKFNFRLTTNGHAVNN